MNITNIVAKSQTNTLDLTEVYMSASAMGLETTMPSKFPAVFVKASGLGTCTFFRTGTVTFNGVKSQSNLNKLAAVAQDITLTQLSSPQIVNVVGSFKTGNKLNLTILSQRIAKSLYEPDLTNTIELPVGCCKALLHHTGSGIIAGAKGIDELFACYGLLLDILKH